MNKPIFQKGDQVLIKSFSELSPDELALTKSVSTYHDGSKDGISLEDTIQEIEKSYDPESGHIIRVYPKARWEIIPKWESANLTSSEKAIVIIGPSYSVEFSGGTPWSSFSGATARYNFPEFLLKHKLELSPETDKVFRDVLRGI